MNNAKDVLTFEPSDFTFVNKDTVLKDVLSDTPARGYFKDAMFRLVHNKSALIAGIMVILIGFMAVFGPLFNAFGMNDQNVDYINLPPRIPFLSALGIADGTKVLENRRTDNLNDPEKYPNGSIIDYKVVDVVNGIEMADVTIDAYKFAGVPDDVNFWFGTDYLGRDLWTRLWMGARVSLLIAILAVGANIVIGVVFGAICGYYGGKIDMVGMRITEILGAFPQSIIATMLVLVVGRGMTGMICALLIKGWTDTARLIRAQFLRFKGREYVLAARSLGVDDKKLIFRHILPNSVGPLITQAMIAIPNAIFSEAFLSFIGLGLQAPQTSIGVLLSDAQKTLLTYPYQMVFPALLISVLMISFNMLGNGLRDAIDPTMRGVD